MRALPPRPAHSVVAISGRFIRPRAAGGGMRRRLLTGAATSGLALVLVVGSPGPAAPPAARAQSAGLTVEPTLAVPAGPRIADIRVQGNLRVDETTILSYLTVRPGDAIDPARINQNVRVLFDTGLFETVDIRVAGNTLVVQVVENPVVNRVAFEGNLEIKDDTLSAEVAVQERRVFTPTRVQRDVDRILEIYRRSGRFAATVEAKIIRLDQNRVDVVFEINEGEKTHIGRIDFIGNTAFSDTRLRNEIRTTETRWYRFLTADDTYDPDRIAFDEELLRRFYLKEGYADFRVLSSVAELSPGGGEFFLTFSLEEGPQYTVGELQVVSEIPDVDPAALRPLVELESGDTYNNTLVEDGTRAIVDSLNRNNVPFVEVDPQVRRNPEAQTLDLTLVIKPAPRRFVERIDIAGNSRTLDQVIRREFLLVEGDPFNAANLRESERRIRGLGFFREVRVNTVAGSGPDQQVVQVEVEEQSTGEISIGGGFSTSDGPGGQVTVTERNFLGRGQTIRIGTSLSARRQEIDFSFTEPYFLQRDLAATVDVFHRTTSFDEESSFDVRETGAGLTFGFPLGENLRQTVGYRFEREELLDIDDDASRAVREAEDETYLSQISQAITYDRRDSRLFPTDGYLLRLSNDLAGLGGDKRFLRTSARGEYYYPIAEDWVLSGLVEGGYIFGIGDDVGLNDRFYLGGNTLRGFETRGVGPRDTDSDDSLGGNILARGSVELSFPLGLPEDLGLGGHAFGDIGTLTEVDDDFDEIVDDGTPRAAVGLGVSWRSPLGPIRFDYAVPVLKEDYDELQEFRFSFGTTF